jgi:hypothetical protein
VTMVRTKLPDSSAHSRRMPEGPESPPAAGRWVPMKPRAFAAACLAGLTLATLPAQACFDAFVATVGDVHFVGNRGHEGADPSYAEARELARWGTKIDALLADGVSWQLDVSGTYRCHPTPDVCDELAAGEWAEAGRADTAGLASLLARTFDRISAHEATPPADIARARGAATDLFAVQVGSFSSPSFAESLARSINERNLRDELPWERETFYTAGGFPAIHDVAFVVEADVGGKRMHRVVVGMFTEAAEALAHQRSIASAGHPVAITSERLR